MPDSSATFCIHVGVLGSTAAEPNSCLKDNADVFVYVFKV